MKPHTEVTYEIQFASDASSGHCGSNLANGSHRGVRRELDIRSIANEDGSCRMCVVDLPNLGPHGGLCRALLAREHVDALIERITPGVGWRERESGTSALCCHWPCLGRDKRRYRAAGVF